MQQYIFPLIVMILAGGLAAGKAGASELEVAPVLLNLAPGQTSATMEVRNRDDAPVTIQARPFLWSQTQDDDVLTPTSEMILSPPIFTIPAGATQTVRLLLRGDARIETGRDRNYRLLLDEVPSAHTRNGQVTVTLRMSVPVFATSEGSSPALTWTAARSPGGEFVLTAANTGRAYVRVNALEATLADGSHPDVTAQGKSPYVLAGAQRRWVLEEPVAAGDSPLRLRVTTHLGTSDVTLSP
jgi:fimbrial chaperone protein